MKYKIFETDEYGEWYLTERPKSKVQIAKRLDKIKEEGYFGDIRKLRDNIFELKWVNGRRIYYALVPELQILLLLGGNKNGQTKDIAQAEKIYKEWIDEY